MRALERVSLLLAGAVVTWIVLVVLSALLSPTPRLILGACGGWYGWNPQTGRCDAGMPSGPPYPPPWATP